METNIILIGYRATGKTVIGKYLSYITNMDFIDLDFLIEEELGVSIYEVFRNFGEKYFREIETSRLNSIQFVKNTIISTGGGIVESKFNTEILKKMGFIIWLKANPKIIYQRIIKDKIIRPKLTNLSLIEEIETKLKNRIELYHNISDYEINTDFLSIEECCKMIIGNINFIKKQNN